MDASLGAPPRDGGQTMAEYGLVLAGVFLLVAGSVIAFGPPLNGLWQQTVAAF